MMQNKIVLIIVVLLVLAGGYFFISNSNTAAPTPAPEVKDISPVMEDEDKPEETDDAMEKDDTSEDAITNDDEAVTIEVGGGAFYFNPTEITVTEGDTVKIVFTNEGGVHDFTLDEFDVKSETLQTTGATTEVTFVADTAGTYEYYCSIANHREMGMVGTLTVEPKL